MVLTFEEKCWKLEKHFNYFEIAELLDSHYELVRDMAIKHLIFREKQNVLENFIIRWTSDDKERERMRDVAIDVMKDEED